VARQSLGSDRRAGESPCDLARPAVLRPGELRRVEHDVHRHGPVQARSLQRGQIVPLLRLDRNHRVPGRDSAELVHSLAGSEETISTASPFAFTHVAYDIERLPVALADMALLMILCKAGALRWLTSRLAAIGQMALSNYILQSVVCTFVFTGYGFGLYGRLERYQLYYVVRDAGPCLWRRVPFGCSITALGRSNGAGGR
jgi:hypothetical protein